MQCLAYSSRSQVFLKLICTHWALSIFITLKWEPREEEGVSTSEAVALRSQQANQEPPSSFSHLPACPNAAIPTCCSKSRWRSLHFTARNSSAQPVTAEQPPWPGPWSPDAQPASLSQQPSECMSSPSLRLARGWHSYMLLTDQSHAPWHQGPWPAWKTEVLLRRGSQVWGPGAHVQNSSQ